MHYIEVYFCQQSEFGDSADSSITLSCLIKFRTPINVRERQNIKLIFPKNRPYNKGVRDGINPQINKRSVDIY